MPNVKQSHSSVPGVFVNAWVRISSALMYRNSPEIKSILFWIICHSANALPVHLLGIVSGERVPSADSSELDRFAARDVPHHVPHHVPPAMRLRV